MPRYRDMSEKNDSLPPFPLQVPCHAQKLIQVRRSFRPEPRLTTWKASQQDDFKLDCYNPRDKKKFRLNCSGFRPNGRPNSLLAETDREKVVDWASYVHANTTFPSTGLHCWFRGSCRVTSALNIQGGSVRARVCLNQQHARYYPVPFVGLVALRLPENGGDFEDAGRGRETCLWQAVGLLVGGKSFTC